MGEIDKILLKGKKPGDDLDTVIKESEEGLAREAQEWKVREIITNRKKNVALAEKDIMAVKGGPAAVADAAISQVSEKAQAAFLKALIDSGTDPKKAQEFIKELDQDVMAKLLVLSGNSTGSNSLVPLFLLARQPQTSVTEIVNAAKTVSEMIPKPEAPKNATLVEITEALRTLHELSQPTDSGGTDALLDELKEIKANQARITEQMHEREMSHAKEIAQMKEDNLRTELGEVRQELANLGKKNLKTEVAEAKELMESLGFKITVGGSTGPDLEKVAKTIMDSKAVTGLADSLGDAVRERAKARTSSMARSTDETFFCPKCQERGVRTPLRLAPNQNSITCPACGTEFGRQGT